MFSRCKVNYYLVIMKTFLVFLFFLINNKIFLNIIQLAESKKKHGLDNQIHVFNVFQVVKLQITEEAAACTQLMAHDT